MLYADLGYRLKKTLHHPKACPEARTSFQNKIQAFEDSGRCIVYQDESGFSKGVTRTHGYSKKGNRCYGSHNWNEKGRVNAVGALLGKSLLTVSLFEGSINSDVFYAWVRQDLLRKLPAASVLVMDNATFHKRSDILKSIESAGHEVLFLPPYSPDLNPIEKKWAQYKKIRQREGSDPETLFAQYKL